MNTFTQSETWPTSAASLALPCSHSARSGRVAPFKLLVVGLLHSRSCRDRQSRVDGIGPIRELQQLGHHLRRRPPAQSSAVVPSGYFSLSLSRVAHHPPVDGQLQRYPKHHQFIMNDTVSLSSSSSSQRRPLRRAVTSPASPTGTRPNAAASQIQQHQQPVAAREPRTVSASALENAIIKLASQHQ